jgi:GTP cyclohydrolase I
MKYILCTEDVAVMINAEHYCVKSRGVEDHGSATVTTHLSGAFKEDGKARAEFIAIART